MAGSDVLDFRNLLPLWLPCALIVATGLGTRRAGLAGVLAACAIGATGIVTATAVLTNPALQRPDGRGVANSVASRPERAIFMVNGCETLPLSLYLPRLQHAPTAGVEVREVDVIRAAGQTSLAHILDTAGTSVRSHSARVTVARSAGPVRTGPPGCARPSVADRAARRSAA